MPNPLGSLPPSNSQQLRLNAIDWVKILRFVLIQACGLFLSEVPKLMGYNYVWHGVDWTPYVLIGVSALSEAARRFLAGQPKAAA